MQLSKRTRYGFRLMVELAANYEKGPVSLQEIAKRQNLSEKYLGQIIIQLKATGPIIAVRGPKGGYRLSMPPSRITLKSIYDILEGSSGIVECVEDPSICRRSSSCVSRNLWVTLEKSMIETLRTKTLGDLITGDPADLELDRKQADRSAKSINNGRNRCPDRR